MPKRKILNNAREGIFFKMHSKIVCRMFDRGLSAKEKYTLARIRHELHKIEEKRCIKGFAKMQAVTSRLEEFVKEMKEAMEVSRIRDLYESSSVPGWEMMGYFDE